MASPLDLRELERGCPWTREDFRAGLAALSNSAADAARRFAADVKVLAGLTAMVPRCAFDQRGATPWTSFRREVAVARKVTDRAAATAIRQSVMLTTELPVTLSLLEAGRFTVERATAFISALEGYDTALTSRIDADLANRAAGLAPWRIAQEVRKALAGLDPETSARRVSEKNASRGISLCPDADDQASLTIFGPAVPITRWHTTLDEQARALKAAGDPRGLDALRFDLAMASLPCATHAPADTTAPAETAPAACAPAGLRPSFVEAAPVDCRRGRPVQAHIVVPVETALGLANEPGWLTGYGWISAPTCRQLLVDAELRRICVQTGTGQLVDVGERAVRPPPAPAGVRAGLLDMVLDTPTLTGAADRVEPDHDPSEPLRRFVLIRDTTCDGPTQSPTPARTCHVDHETPYPAGPTAAWNLATRATRTHQLKHYGWTPLRTPTYTIWTSPAGQLVAVPHHTTPPPGIDTDSTGKQPHLPDPHDLDLLDRAQLEAPVDAPPWLPDDERDPTQWTWLHDDHDVHGHDDIAC